MVTHTTVKLSSWIFPTVTQPLMSGMHVQDERADTLEAPSRYPVDRHNPLNTFPTLVTPVPIANPDPKVVQDSDKQMA